MNDQFAACPTSEQLKALLDGSLTEPEQTLLQGHVDGCATCQKALESLVAGTESWDAAVGHLRGESAQPDAAILSEAIRNLKADEFMEASSRGGSASMKPLDFLEPSDRPGSIGRLGVYEVSEVVGQGGMGVVLKAFDPSLHRVVAVKVLAPYLAHNPQARKRFIREAQAIAAVCHDHVITIHAIDESAEQPKIVMQFISGMSLQEKLDTEGSLDLKEILRIGMQTASGLAAAHAQGLVHRDVKPSNILLENGIQRVKLTDFGLARAVDDASLTQSGVIAGTPQYMAPEQANGDAVDYRADLFSLGSVMYAMCVGHSPFRASTTMGVLKRVCHDPPRPIQELNPDIPDWLCAIVMKLLAKQPKDRFQSAKSVAEILEKWLAHVQQPSVVPRPPSIEGASAANGGSSSSASARDTSSPRTSSAGGPSADWNESRRFLDSGTILFQPISGRWLLFLLLAGTTLSFGFMMSQRVGIAEAAVTSVFGGLISCFWGMLFVSLVRLVWANVYGAVKSTAGNSGDSNSTANDRHSSRPRAGWRLPPESMAMLAALGTMVLGGHFLFAAIVAIVVWRIATHYARAGESQPAALVDADATRTDVGAGTERQSFAARVNSVLQIPALVLQRLGETLGSVFDLEPAERNRLLIAIAWCCVGGVDLIGVAVFATMLLSMCLWRPRHDDVPIVFLMAVVSLVMSLLSLVVSHCIYVRQNFNHVRGASVLGLLPVSYGAFVRIPLSVITLLWQHAPSVKETFATTPWPETDLGRFIRGRVSSTLRCWMQSMGRLAAWSVLCGVLLVMLIVLYVIPFGPSIYIVNDVSALQVALVVKGQPKTTFELQATGTASTFGLIPPDHVYSRD
ncbi:MAG: protein kinase, partial [Candidatus Saccharimonas sp.]|nr:protein kinase [Planctomycetaceae bacterium]